MLNEFKSIFVDIIHNPRCNIVPLDENIVEIIPPDLEMHDGIIVATAKYIEKIEKEDVIIISCDRIINSLKIVKTIW